MRRRRSRLHLSFFDDLNPEAYLPSQRLRFLVLFKHA
jgi:hypothetical protein